MSISIGNTYFTNYNVDAADTSAGRVTSKIQAAEQDEEMLDACKQFEAYMIQQMFKNMERAAKVFSQDDEEDSSTSMWKCFRITIWRVFQIPWYTMERDSALPSSCMTRFRGTQGRQRRQPSVIQRKSK